MSCKNRITSTLIELCRHRQLLWIVAYYGGMIGFYSGDMKLIFDDMQTFNPTYLSAPPRIYNAVYTQYKEAVGFSFRCLSYSVFCVSYCSSLRVGMCG